MKKFFKNQRYTFKDQVLQLTEIFPLMINVNKRLKQYYSISNIHKININKNNIKIWYFCKNNERLGNFFKKELSKDQIISNLGSTFLKWLIEYSKNLKLLKRYCNCNLPLEEFSSFIDYNADTKLITILNFVFDNDRIENYIYRHLTIEEFLNGDNETRECMLLLSYLNRAKDKNFPKFVSYFKPTKGEKGTLFLSISASSVPVDDITIDDINISDTEYFFKLEDELNKYFKEVIIGEAGYLFAYIDRISFI